MYNFNVKIPRCLKMLKDVVPPAKQFKLFVFFVSDFYSKKQRAYIFTPFTSSTLKYSISCIKYCYKLYQHQIRYLHTVPIK